MTRIGLKPALISLAGLACLFAVLHAHPSTADDEADLLSQSVPGPRVELSDDPDDPGELPEDVTADQHQTQVRVDAFLQTMIAKFGADLRASVDWEKQQIRLLGASAAMSELKTFDGQLVAGMAVTVSKAEIDRHQYEAAIATLTAAKVSLPIEIASFGLPAHSEFIDIKVLNLSRHPADLVQEFRTQIARLLEVPFRLTEAPPENWTDRGDSQAPWTGGVQMRHNVGSAGAACSTAFSVVKGGTGYVLSAAHCDQTTSAPRWSWLDWANNSWISYASGFAGKTPKKTLDSLLLDPQGGTIGKIHSGKWNQAAGTSRYLMKVNGATATYIGSPVCTNGANSGQHCNLLVYDNDDVYCASQGICHRWIAFHNNSNGVAVANADSGGGVYFDLGNDRVGARGVISRANGTQVDCNNTRFNASVCSNGVLFVDIVDVLQNWGVSIEKS